MRGILHDGALPLQTIANTQHFLHQSPGELTQDGYVPAFEKPERAELILARINAVGLGPVSPETPHSLADILRVHDAGLVALLHGAASEWAALGRAGAAMPFTWPARGMRQDRLPASLDGRLSYYCFDAACPITPTSWQAIKASADTALTAAGLLAGGAPSAFALCRPPGHHAGSDHYGGYCFLNNAAIAAQKLLDQGAARIAILDVDYHHGNGTQQIFYHRPDVLVVNLHGDPDFEYPFHLGHADETGAGAGEGFNLNVPLPRGTAWPSYAEALTAAIARILSYGPDAVVVSLGVDTYKGDPISHFKLEHEDYPVMGAMIKSLGKPTLFVMEGGYAVAEIGINAVNVLTGFSG
jgi:acetoin utilization deacetylase AcuC-like enzyme